jgi:hypothetical protein
VEWHWVNTARLTTALDKWAPTVDNDDMDAVLDALEEIAANPYDSLQTAKMQGTRDHVDRWVALLPHNWILVYSIYPAGVVPTTNQPSLLVRDFMQGFPE